MSCWTLALPIRNLRSEPEELPPAGILENCGVSSGSLSLQTQWLDWTIKLMPPLRLLLSATRWNATSGAQGGGHWGNLSFVVEELYLGALHLQVVSCMASDWGTNTCLAVAFKHLFTCSSIFLSFSHSLGRCHPSIRMAGHWHQSGSSGTARSAMP